VSSHKPFRIERNHEKRLTNEEIRARNQGIIYEWLKDHSESTIEAVSKGVRISRERVSLHLKTLEGKGKVQKDNGRWSTASFIEQKRMAEIQSKQAYRRIMQIGENNLEGYFRDFTRPKPTKIIGLERSDVCKRIFDETLETRLKRHGNKEIARREAEFFPDIFSKSVHVKVFSPFQMSRSKEMTVITRGLFSLKKEKGSSYRIRESAVDLMYTLFKTVDLQVTSKENDEIVVEITLSPSEILRHILSLKKMFDDIMKSAREHGSLEIHGKSYPADSPRLQKEFPPLFSDLVDSQAARDKCLKGKDAKEERPMDTEAKHKF
jgi:DNA-binding transcriptional ArsR family regulator